MLLVLSSIADTQAEAAVALWRAKGATASLVTPYDVAQAGWKLGDGEPTLVVGGARVAASKVKGVVTRLAHVTTGELPFMHDEDREYAATEMQAFLLALLSRMKCPVLNTPVPGSLTGPAWAPEQWAMCAKGAGIAVRPVVRRVYAGGAVVPEDAQVDRRDVSVVGDTAFGDEVLRKPAVAIAKAAGVTLLRVTFDMRDAPVFLGADVWVDISNEVIAETIRKRFA